MPKRRISRVTTGRGDQGETSLADGSAIGKSDARIHTIGAVDELNSFVGLLKVELAATPSNAPFTELCTKLQQELFDLGANLATVGATPVPAIDWLDDAIADLNSQLPPLTEFVIPGGTRSASLTHVCRTVCRRAERHCWAVPDAGTVARYLNRLSDLLFIMARLLNAGEEPEWRGPGNL